MRWRLFGSLGLAAALAVPSLATAQQVRAGAEFRANTYTTATQRRADVHYKANGDFIVTWGGFGPLDSSFYGVSGQRYDAAGTPQGAEFGVNTYTTNYQFLPLAASDRRGNFVIVWGSYFQDGSYYGVFGQRFNAAGAKVGGEFQVNSYTLGGQGSSFYFLENNTAVAMAPGGNFVVVWGTYYDQADGQDGDLGAVFGQRYDASGVRVGGEFRVNTYTTGYQAAPSIAMRDDSSFIVTWQTYDGDGFGIVGQRYDPAGARIGGEFAVPSSTTGSQESSVVRMAASGDFTVVWSDNALGGELVARRFNAAGAPLGAQFAVNTYTTGSQYTYAFGMDRRGNFVVHWANLVDDYPTEIRGRRFRSDGSPRGAEYVVNTYTSGFQFEATAANDDVGNLVSAWTDEFRDGSPFGVFAQRFGGLRPTALAVNIPPGNQVWEPGESTDVRPTWRNFNGAAQTFGGTLTNLIGPTATYTIGDGTASYGTVANNAAAQCTDCYTVSVNNPPTRPVQHWDATAVETITPDTQGQQKQFDPAPRQQLHGRAHLQRLLPVRRDPVPPRDHRRLRRHELLPGQHRHSRPDVRVRPGGQGGAGVPASRLRAAEPVRRRAGEQPVLPVHRGAGQPRRGGRLRRRQLLPGQPGLA